ncbi:MAG TPA: amidase [Candidatus Binataceae bacterium]|nr:amidase [Candidatus Binataceae bacterium]
MAVTAFDPLRASIGELGEALRARRISIRELADAHLERLGQINPKINAFALPDPDGARIAAAALDSELAAGKPRSVMHGIPITIKELFATRGQRTAAGSLILRDRVTDHDAEVVANLRAAGAVILGKTSMDEFAFSPTGLNAHYGPVRNPWDTSRITGGSSSGAAAALAAGVGSAALGSDTGGSVRLPASLCGVVGFKPSYDRLSRRGAFPLSWSLDHPGLFGRSVTDVSAAFDCAASAENRLGELHHPPARELRCGVIEDYCAGVDSEVGARWDEFIRALSGAGVRVSPVAPKTLKLVAAVSTAIMFGEGGAVHRQWLATRREDYGRPIRMRLLQGALIPAATYLRALQLRRTIAEEFAALFENLDCLICPTNTTVAQPIDSVDAQTGGRVIRNTRLAPLLGIPGISLPIPTRGMPVGAQLMGAVGGDARLLAAAAVVEKIIGPAFAAPL